MQIKCEFHYQELKQQSFAMAHKEASRVGPDQGRPGRPPRAQELGGTENFIFHIEKMRGQIM